MKRYFVFVLIAIFAGIVTVYSDKKQLVDPCVDTPGCVAVNDNNISGTAITETRGYPLAVQQSRVFQPAKAVHYDETRLETQNFSLLNAFINVVFWISLFDFGTRLYVRIRSYMVLRRKIGSELNEN